MIVVILAKSSVTKGEVRCIICTNSFFKLLVFHSSRNSMYVVQQHIRLHMLILFIVGSHGKYSFKNKLSCCPFQYPNKTEAEKSEPTLSAQNPARSKGTTHATGALNSFPIQVVKEGFLLEIRTLQITAMLLLLLVVALFQLCASIYRYVVLLLITPILGSFYKKQFLHLNFEIEQFG